MSKNEDGLQWQPTWTQAMTDFRGDDEEPHFADVTVRMTVPVSNEWIRTAGHEFVDFDTAIRSE